MVTYEERKEKDRTGQDRTDRRIRKEFKDDYFRCYLVVEAF